MDRRIPRLLGAVALTCGLALSNFTAATADHHGADHHQPPPEIPVDAAKDAISKLPSALQPSYNAALQVDIGTRDAMRSGDPAKMMEAGKKIGEAIKKAMENTIQFLGGASPEDANKVAGVLHFFASNGQPAGPAPPGSEAINMAQRMLQDAANMMQGHPPAGDPGTAPPGSSDPNMPPPTGDPNMPPHTGDPHMPPPTGDPNMPPPTGDPNMPPPTGDPNMMPPPPGDPNMPPPPPGDPNMPPPPPGDPNMPPPPPVGDPGMQPPPPPPTGDMPPMPPTGDAPPMPPTGDMPPMPPGDGHPPMGDAAPMSPDGALLVGPGMFPNIAPECSDDLRNSELQPQGTMEKDGMTGNILFRTVCNSPGWESNAITLPAGRNASNFGIEAATTGKVYFGIGVEGGAPVWTTADGKAAFEALHLTSAAPSPNGKYTIMIDPSKSDPGVRVTVRFVDHP